MENREFNSNFSRKQSLPPPRRGQIKIRIFKTVVSMVGGFIRKPVEDGGSSSSNPQTPAETPSGYCSDAQSDGSDNPIR
ncbi:hypothetical protein M0R45_016950 [Rubus argutus]|uniref:Uncharacterized protein n=1 Tax=Rubus argutus TaxID=59490 RepID=A0AAW1XUN3_RUBAR